MSEHPPFLEHYIEARDRMIAASIEFRNACLAIEPKCLKARTAIIELGQLMEKGLKGAAVSEGGGVL